MNDLLDLIVFSPDADQRARRSGALAEMGFSPRRCEDSNGLFRLFQTRRTPLLVMEAELTDLCMAVAGLRAMDTTAGIVAISTFDSPENRILGLHCGADVCFQPDVATAEIAAALQALVRRTPPSTPPRRGGDARAASVRRRRRRTLAVPGRRLDPGQPARRAPAADPGRARIPAQADLGHGQAPAAQRRLRARPQAGRDSVRRTDVVVSRLRRKAQDMHLDLPIRTVWGWGYAFTGEI